MRLSPPSAHIKVGRADGTLACFCDQNVLEAPRVDPCLPKHPVGAFMLAWRLQGQHIPTDIRVDQVSDRRCHQVGQIHRADLAHTSPVHSSSTEGKGPVNVRILFRGLGADTCHDETVMPPKSFHARNPERFSPDLYTPEGICQTCMHTPRGIHRLSGRGAISCF